MLKGQARAPAGPRAQNGNHLPGACAAATAASGRAGTDSASLAHARGSCCSPAPSPRPGLPWARTDTAQRWLLPQGLGHLVSQAPWYISHQGLAPSARAQSSPPHGGCTLRPPPYFCSSKTDKQYLWCSSAQRDAGKEQPVSRGRWLVQRHTPTGGQRTASRTPPRKQAGAGRARLPVLPRAPCCPPGTGPAGKLQRWWGSREREDTHSSSQPQQQQHRDSHARHQPPSLHRSQRLALLHGCALSGCRLVLRGSTAG